MLKENHLSYYNEVDIQTLKECKAIVPSGILPDGRIQDGKPSSVVPVGKLFKDAPIKKIKEIDINKACTHARGSIKYIPRFT